MNRFFFSLFFILFFTSAAQAYIPPYWMIMSRTADNHGLGLFQVDQDVIFNHGDEPFVVNERWIIQSENAMRVEVTGKKQLQDRLRLTYVYQNGRRYYVDENGVRRSEPVTDNFLEAYFHFRYSKFIKPILVRQDIAPAVSLKSEPHHYSQKRPRPEPEPYVRLSRTGGVVNYAIGTPTPPSASDPYPGLWIEQDQFYIRKIRLRSLVEVSANNYASYGKGLWFPKERQITWSGQSAKVTLNRAVSIAPTTTVKAALESSSLNFGKDPKLSRVLPDDKVIQTFYTQFR